MLAFLLVVYVLGYAFVYGLAWGYFTKANLKMPIIRVVLGGFLWPILFALAFGHVAGEDVWAGRNKGASCRATPNTETA